MKKSTYLLFTLLMLLVLAACSPGTQTATDPSTSTTDTDTVSANGTSAMQLALGTFALEDTEYAITSEQATELIQLWKAAQALSDSDTITAEEFQAIFSQIEDTLTPEQLNYITTMELSQEAMTALQEKYGLTFGPGNGGGFDPNNMTEEQQATAEAFRSTIQQSGGQAPGGGDFPGGGPGGGAPPDGGFAGGGPGGGGGFPGGGDVGSLPEAQQTAIAPGAGRGAGGGGGLPTTFYDAILQFLETKLQ